MQDGDESVAIICMALFFVVIQIPMSAAYLAGRLRERRFAKAVIEHNRVHFK